MSDRSSNPTVGKDLESDLRQAGFASGAPAHLAPDIVAIDRRAYGAMKCPRCERRMEFRPYHRGRQYRAVAACPHCHAATEV